MGTSTSSPRQPRVGGGVSHPQGVGRALAVLKRLKGPVSRPFFQLLRTLRSVFVVLRKA